MNETKAARYQRLKRRTEAVGLLSGAVMLLLLVLTPGARGLARWATSVGAGASAPVAALVSLGAFVACAVVLWELLALPSALYWSLTVGRRYGRAESDGTVESVLAAQAQASVVALVSAAVAGLVVQLSIWLVDGWWWLLSGLALAGVLAAALGVAPWVLAWLGEAGPVSRPALADRLAALAARARVAVAGIDEWRVGRSPRTAGSTAIVAGVGRARRVFVSRELIDDWSDEEVAVVVAHELAHHAHHDLWRTLAVDGAVLAASFGIAELMREWVGSALGLAGRGNLAELPFVALVAGAAWIGATPVRHAYSRRQERAADEFALAITGETEAFGSALRRLSARHLVEERPARAIRWLYHRHPTVAERLETADRYARHLAAGASARPVSAGPR
jgi:STE24 endopeptidase